MLPLYTIIRLFLVPKIQVVFACENIKTKQKTKQKISFDYFRKLIRNYGGDGHVYYFVVSIQGMYTYVQTNKILYIIHV